MIATTRRSGGVVEPSGEWVRHSGDTFRYPIAVTATATGYAAASFTTPAFHAVAPTQAEAVDALVAVLSEALRTSKSGTGERPRSVETPDDAQWVIVSL